MRKQTKVVAVASAAALLAIGASMTSFAATGWVEEDGVWYWYDKDGNRVTDVWKKSGDNWYWLDGEDDGAMATDKLIEDDDDTYYVDANGAMVKNTWVKVVNEDQDDDEDPAEYHYYYMQSSGKAYKAPDSGNTTFKTIDGKRYAFDDDGVMLYGWVNDSSERETDDDGWKNAIYYLGSWEDGAMKTGWQKITVYDDEDDKEDDYDYWFNFKSNGKKRVHVESGTDDVEDADKTWKSGGKYYHFNQYGVMVYEWYNVASSGNGDVASAASSWRYFRSPEDGARVTKGWFKVVAPAEDSDNSFLNYSDDDSFAKTDATDEEERWYYADSKGVLKVGVIDKISGKYYGFYPDSVSSTSGDDKSARMLTGLNRITVDTDGKITDVLDDNVESDELDDLTDVDVSSTWAGDLYYFGGKDDGDTDGTMKTGNVTVTLDGESYKFFFQKTGTPASGRGKGVTGIDDNKYIYFKGLRIEADSDDKYQLVEVTPDPTSTSTSVDYNADNAIVTKLDAPTSGNISALGGDSFSYTNKDGDTVNVYVLNSSDLYLVNTSGNIQKTKTSGVKDGNDCYYYVTKNRHVVFYTDNKVLKTSTDYASSNSTWDATNADGTTNAFTVSGNTLSDLATAYETYIWSASRASQFADDNGDFALVD